MSDDRRFYVVEAPRTAYGRLFQAGSVAECLAWAGRRSGPGAPRLAVWAAVPPPDDDADLFLCMPVSVLLDARQVAAEVVDRWEANWLLIESAPRRHREEAREALLDRLAQALAAAAVKGFDDRMDIEF